MTPYIQPNVAKFSRIRRLITAIIIVLNELGTSKPPHCSDIIKVATPLLHFQSRYLMFNSTQKNLTTTTALEDVGPYCGLLKQFELCHTPIPVEKLPEHGWFLAEFS